MRHGWLLALVACGNREQPAPGVGTASAAPAPDAPAAVDGWTVLKQSTDKLELVRGTWRVGIVEGTRWFAVAGKELREDRRVGEALEQACGDGDRTLLLGQTPVVVCGEEHHERATRLPGKRLEIADPVAVATLSSDSELWLYGTAPRTQLVAARVGSAAHIATFPRQGALPDSTVRARLCADPPVVDVAGDTTTAAALVVECDPAAPIRIAAWQRIAETPDKLTTLDPKGLGFVPERLAVAGNATVVAGVADGRVVVARLEASPEITRGDGPASHVVGLELVRGHVWTLAVGVAGKRDVWTLARDGATQTTPFGEPRALGYDRSLGIVVLATSATGWTVAAHPP